jgi:beta-glucanase (GH16 family)
VIDLISLVRRRGLPILAAAVLGGCAAAPPAPSARLAVPPGYALVWADEFDRDGLPDASRWDYDTGRNKDGWYNHEQQYYAGPRAENAVVRSGRLVITARRESLATAPDWGGQAYTSARLITRGKAQWTYGFFEVRARMPCGRGTWPAIWMVGAAGRWPDDGELDILEHVGSNPERVSSAVHTAAASGGTAVSGKQRVPDACTAMHDYQMLWTPEGIWFGVDGLTHWHYARRLQADPRGWPFDAPQFLILNIAIGGDLGGPVDDGAFPLTMEIEHVRVWQRIPQRVP